MPKYVIERDLPGAGKLSKAELKAASQKSNEILRDLGPTIQWVHSYVTDDMIICVYNAPNIDIIKEHAKSLGLPATRILRVRGIIDPTTSED